MSLDFDMPRPRIILLSSTVLVLALLLTLLFVGPSVQKSLFYPKPRDLPPNVSQKMGDLLSKLQATLEMNASAVSHSLQLGLTDSEISTLEARGGFHLSEDLKAFYRWHKGMPANKSMGLLPGHRFLPLEEAVQEHTLLNQRMSNTPLVQRAGVAIFAAHRKPWIHILDDGAGDGYFYDPERTDAQGAFFYHFAESSEYLWFPSLRNFLLGTIECYETKVIKVANDKVELEENPDQAEKIWARFGAGKHLGDQ